MNVLLIIFYLFFHSNSIVNGFICIYDGLFANPDNQSSFYQCSFGTAFLMSFIKFTSSSCDSSQIKNCRETSQWSSDGIAFVGKDSKWGSDSQHLGSPFGLFIDVEHGNNVYVADVDNHRIQKFLRGSLDNGGITVAGGNGKGNASNQLAEPRAIYVDKNENVYIVDNDNYRIQLWKKDAKEGITIAGGNGKGIELNQIGASQGLFVHEKTNTLYISDFYNDRVVKWDSKTNQGIIVAGGNRGGKNSNQLSMPRGIFVDDCENIYIADLFNHRIQLWKKDAKEGITVAGGNGMERNTNQLNNPWDVKVDQFKNIYIVDTDNARIVKWTQNQTFGQIIVGGNGSGNKPNQFRAAHGLALDKEGNIFVSERLNARIQMFQIDQKTNSC
ncbi:unnamed protein product [Adineta ricciae]|uniref:Uncharacterized protein n=1 Tax=Adineta ricciae TaxID=249248 RepID=A0A814GT87_ADIRI|nr:unnamed protein product [Adineta ricciae]